MSQAQPTSYARATFTVPPANRAGAPLFPENRVLPPPSQYQGAQSAYVNRNITPATPRAVSPRASPLKPGEEETTTCRETEDGVVCTRTVTVQRVSAWAYVIISLIIIGIIWLIIRGSLTNNFYNVVNKPSWAPTSQVFFVGWIIAILLLGVIASRGNVGSTLGSSRNSLAIAYGIEVVLIVIWALLFFVQRNIIWSLIVGIITWFVALWIIFILWNLDRPAAYLAILYTLWVTYIVLVNWQINQLNTA